MHGGDMSDQSNIRPGSACPSEVTDARLALTGAQSEHAAIVLAGGDGTRLNEFTREMFGEEIPKQFCKFWGEHTLLEQTRRRAGLFIDPARTITVLTASHARFYRPLLEGLGQGHLAIQPESRGTAPAILYALMRLKKLAPNCSVAMFPSDHFVDDDRRFMRHVEAALRAVDDRPEQTILLGIEPTAPDAQYGWIEPGELVANECEPIRQIRRFWEKPPLPIARRLMNSGCLWNSFVIVSRLSTFLGLFLCAMPALYEAFRAIEGELGTLSEMSRVRRLYQDIDASNFSDEILAKYPLNLAVLRVHGVQWDDLGDPRRLANLLKRRELPAPARSSGIARTRPAYSGHRGTAGNTGNLSVL
jgi:mannose-1-phosphate guanylyltransferase